MDGPVDTKPRRVEADTRYALTPVPVWDWPVRAFHWSIVALVAGLLVTGLYGGNLLAWHMRFGQAVLALVAFRVIWGFIGSRNARFGTFVAGPANVLRYARLFFRHPHPAHASHNPLGGWMVLFLLLALLVQAGTGLFTNDDILWDGPMVKRVSKDASDAISSFHRRFWWVLVAATAVHVGAVLTHLLLHRENLVTPMLTGVKQLPEGVAVPEDATTSTLKALVLLALCVVAVFYPLNRF